MRLLALALVVTSAACRCGQGGADGGRTVEVARFRTLVSASGSEEVPFDLSDSDLSALISEDGGPRVVYPTITGAGAATFYGLPPGTFVLSINGYNLVTNEDRIDLGVATLGRASAALTDGGVVLQLDVTGLQPWQPYSDVLQLSAPNAGYVAVNAQSYVGTQPDAGITSALVPLAYWQACSTQRGRLAPLVDSDAGDIVTLTQLASAPVGDAGLLELRTLVRAAVLPPFVMADGTTTAVTAALASASRQETIALDYRQSAFDALRPQIHPMAIAISSSVTVTALPFTAMQGQFTAAPDLAVLRPQQTSADVALTFDTGNPFPPEWPKVVSARYTVQVDFAFPDGGSRTLTTAVVNQDLASALTGMPLQPRVSPPRSLRVDGADGLTRAQISRRPVITWEPPATGRATSYGITLFHFSRVGGGPIIALAEEAFFETTELELRVPFGEVTPGGEYVFGVTAFDSPAASVERAPFKSGFPFGVATALTAMMRVDPTLTP